MTTIATRELLKRNFDKKNFDWPTLSKFELTFYPVSGATDELNQVPASDRNLIKRIYASWVIFWRRD